MKNLPKILKDAEINMNYSLDPEGIAVRFMGFESGILTIQIVIQYMDILFPESYGIFQIKCESEAEVEEYLAFAGFSKDSTEWYKLFGR